MSNGTLIIAGGEVGFSKASIFGAYIKAAGGVQKRFALLAAASSNPEDAFTRHVKTLTDLGVPAFNISLLEVSLKRPGWEDGARNPRELEKAEAADAFWIYGGDQNSLVDAMRDAFGRDSHLLAIMRAKLANGSVIGGSSAGAAVMSDIMIGGGTSFGALSQQRAFDPAGEEISDALLVGKGFGFFTGGLVDQHFDTRARLARLAEVSLVDDGARRPAFGIAEDTAMVVYLDTQQVEVVGSGGLYIINADLKGRSFINNRLSIKNLFLSYLCEGETYNLDTGCCDSSGKTEIQPGAEYYSVLNPVASGVLSGYGTLAEFIVNFVVDNKIECLFEDRDTNLSYGKSFLMGSDPEDSSRLLCWEIRLGRKAGLSRAWTGSRTSFENIVVEIIPISFFGTVLA